MNQHNNKPIVLRQRSDGALQLIGDDGHNAVRVNRCFPWHNSDRYIFLSDEEGHELALVEDPCALDPESRRCLDQALAVAGFTLQIECILGLEREIEIRNWTVEVGGQVRSFQTELDEWPRTLPDGRTLIRDVAGDLYSIEDPKAMDDASRRHLWALSD